MISGGLERTESQWETLLGEVGLQIMKIWSKDGENLSIIEAVLRVWNDWRIVTDGHGMKIRKIRSDAISFSNADRHLIYYSVWRIRCRQGASSEPAKCQLFWKSTIWLFISDPWWHLISHRLRYCLISQRFYNINKKTDNVVLVPWVCRISYGNSYFVPFLYENKYLGKVGLGKWDKRGSLNKSQIARHTRLEKQSNTATNAQRETTILQRRVLLLISASLGTCSRRIRVGSPESCMASERPIKLELCPDGRYSSRFWLHILFLESWHVSIKVFSCRVPRPLSRSSARPKPICFWGFTPH